MPPVLALFLTLGCIGYLFRRDFRQRPNVTGAIWLPILWMFIIASRPVSIWLSILGLPVQGAVRVEEGSTVDSIFFLFLIVGGVYVLARRQVSLAQVLRDNPWLTLFVAYCFLAVFWSDFPVVSFKRWVKILGHPIMVLVLFTEPDSEEAVIRSIKRCAYVIFPISILWIKYYPALGRKFDEWGAMTSVGIAGGKNELGAVCLFMGAFLLWRWLRIRRADKNRARRDELWLLTFLLSTIAYALWKAHSGTSTICFLLAAAVIFGLGLRTVDKRVIGNYLAILCVAAIAAQLLFDVYGKVVDLSGHESTIEGRGRLWEVLLQTDHDPVLGVGYESYWLGERLQRIWDMPEFRWHPTQAHNGYIETYINLGAVGLLILIGVILAAFRKCLEELRRDFEWGRIMLACLIAIVAHNWTEAGFKALDMVYFFFYLVALKYPWKLTTMTRSEEISKSTSFKFDGAVYAETAESGTGFELAPASAGSGRQAGL